VGHLLNGPSRRRNPGEPDGAQSRQQNFQIFSTLSNGGLLYYYFVNVAQFRVGSHKRRNRELSVVSNHKYVTVLDLCLLDSRGLEFIESLRRALPRHRVLAPGNHQAKPDREQG
jgi:hypothetical protein